LETKVVVLNNQIKKLKAGDILYDMLNFKSLKVPEHNKTEFLIRIVDSNRANQVIRGFPRYEIFDPAKHLELNKQKTIM